MMYTCWWLHAYRGLGLQHLERLGGDTSMALLVLVVGLFITGG
jgi:hypothetical protein